MAENRGWLSSAWDGVCNFVDDAGEAVTVVMNDPGHAAALVVDGFEKGVADVGGLIIGGVPDLVDWGAERAFGVSLYEGSAIAGVSDGLKWGVDGIEGMFGIERPEIRGDGDAFLFGAGRLTGQVTAGGLALANAGAIAGVGRTVLGGAWWGVTHPLQVAGAIQTTATVAAVGATGLAVGDMTLNQGRGIGGLLNGAANWGVQQLTGAPSLSAAYNRFIPQEIRDGIEDFMVFMGENPQWAQWGTFALAMLAGNGIVGSLVSGIMGDNMLSGIIALAVTGLIAWNLASAFTGAATEQAAQRRAEGPQQDGTDAPAVTGQDAAPVVRRETPPQALPAPA